MSWNYNPFTEKLDKTLSAAELKELAKIPQYETDPASPEAESVWFVRSGTGVRPDGSPFGMLLALTCTNDTGAAYSYELSYRTKEGTTLRLGDYIA